MMYFASAIFQICPQVISIVGEDAFDADGNFVAYDRAAVAIEAQRMEAQQQRAAAYAVEADPLAFKYLRDEVDLEQWKAKVNEIRARFPYPTEEVTP